MEIKNFVEIKNLNDYLINDMGVVFSRKSGKELKAHNGTVEVYVDGQKRKMNVARRTCGYIGTNFWNDGRTDEIINRYVHLDNHENIM